MTKTIPVASYLAALFLQLRLCAACLLCVYGIRKYYFNMEEIGRKATTVQTRALLRLESPSAVHWPIEHLQHHAD